MKKIRLSLLSLLVLTISFSTFSQQHKIIDSLNKFIFNAPDNLNKAKAYVQLSEIYYYIKQDTVSFLCERSLDVLNSIKPSKKDYFSYMQTKALAFNNIGIIYQINGNYVKANEFYFKGLKIRETIKDEKGIAESYNNVGSIFLYQTDTIQAISFFKKSMRIAELNKLNNLLPEVYTNLASSYPENKNEIALTYLFKCLEIDKKLNNLNGIGIREHNIAVRYQNSQQYDFANKWYLKSIETKEEIDDQDGIATTFISLAQLNLQLERVDKAEMFAKKAYTIAKEYDFLGNLILSSEILYDIYLNKKNYKQALIYLEELNSYKERKLEEENNSEILKQQLNYKYEKKSAEDSIKSALEKQNLNAKLDVEKEKQIGLYLFILFTLGVSFLIYNRFKKTKKQKGIIEEQKTVVEEKNKEITDSINYARRIQHTLLANEELLNKHFKEHFVIYRPKDIVSGDFYWASQKEHLFYIAACDSTGHGVPGAFMSLLNISFLNEAVNEKNILEPHKILDYVRKRLISNIGQDGAQDGMDGVLLCFDSIAKKVTYSAAYNAPLLISDNKIELLKANRMPIGKSPKEKEHFTLHTLDLKEHDKVYLYTDGYTDQFGGPRGKKFKLKQLEEKLVELSSKSMKKQEKELEDVFDFWKKDYEQVDDMLLIGIKI